MRLIVPLALLACLGWPDKTAAGTVSLEVQTRLDVTARTVKAVITLTNRGSEPAYQLDVMAGTPQPTWTSDVRSMLKPQESYAVTLEQDVGSLPQGRYPFIVHARYTDANRYPFSSLLVAEVAIGSSGRSGISGTLTRGRIDRRGATTLRLGLKNLDQDTRTVRVRLLLPDELATNTPVAASSIPPNGAIEIPFVVRNVSAVGESSYQVYAITEYERDGVHHTSVAACTVPISEGRAAHAFQRALSPSWLALLSALVLLNVWALARARRR